MDESVEFFVSYSEIVNHCRSLTLTHDKGSH